MPTTPAASRSSRTATAAAWWRRDGEAGGIPEVDETVRDGDTVRVGALEGRVIETPGHTSAPATLYFPADKLVFAGDTLFSIGCGRVIEGTMEQMWQSMLKLRALPDDTMVHCGHEYTLANIRFAKTIEPDNKALAAREQEVDAASCRRQADGALARWATRRPPTRSCAPTCRRSPRRVGMAGAPAAEVFAEIRDPEEQVLGRSVQLSAAEIIRLLGLKPHPEGGHFVETHRDRARRTAARTRPRSTFCWRAASARTGTGSTPPRSGTTTPAAR